MKIKVILWALLLAGCHEPPVPCNTAGNGFCDLGVITVYGDMAGSAAGDLAQLPVPDQAVAQDMATAPPDMTPVPPYFFQPVIQNDINFLSCADASCHGTQSRILIPNPTTQAAIDNNYQALLGDAQMGANSVLLQKLLQTSTVVHGGNLAGTKPFTSTSDPIYQRWLDWINTGAPEHP